LTVGHDASLTQSWRPVGRILHTVHIGNCSIFRRSDISKVLLGRLGLGLGVG